MGPLVFGPGPGEKNLQVPVPAKKILVLVPVEKKLIPGPGPLCPSLLFMLIAYKRRVVPVPNMTMMDIE